MSFWGRYWWVFCFCAISSVFYFHTSKAKKMTLHHLSVRLQEMEKEKVLALLQKDDLQLRIASQNDPAWIEMILMRDLGVVPEGFLKVHFKK